MTKENLEDTQIGFIEIHIISEFFLLSMDVDMFSEEIYNCNRKLNEY